MPKQDPEQMSKTDLMAHIEAVDKLYEFRYSAVNKRVAALEERERLTTSAVKELETGMKFGFAEVLLAIANLRVQEKPQDKQEVL